MTGAARRLRAMAEPLDASRPMLTVEDLHVRFADVHAVRGASFTVGDGESYGIVGESGSGKSTVLRAVAGLNASWTGTVRIAGETMGKHRPRSFHKRVQMVFQDP